MKSYKHESSWKLTRLTPRSDHQFAVGEINLMVLSLSFDKHFIMHQQHILVVEVGDNYEGAIC